MAWPWQRADLFANCLRLDEEDCDTRREVDVSKNRAMRNLFDLTWPTLLLTLGARSRQPPRRCISALWLVYTNCLVRTREVRPIFPGNYLVWCHEVTFKSYERVWVNGSRPEFHVHILRPLARIPMPRLPMTLWNLNLKAKKPIGTKGCQLAF